MCPLKFPMFHFLMTFHVLSFDKIFITVLKTINLICYKFSQNYCSLQNSVTGYRAVLQDTRQCYRIQGSVTGYEAVLQDTGQCYRIQCSVTGYKAVLQDTEQSYRIQGSVTGYMTVIQDTGQSYRIVGWLVGCLRLGSHHFLLDGILFGVRLFMDRHVTTSNQDLNQANSNPLICT